MNECSSGVPLHTVIFIALSPIVLLVLASALKSLWDMVRFWKDNTIQPVKRSQPLNLGGPFLVAVWVIGIVSIIGAVVLMMASS